MFVSLSLVSCNFFLPGYPAQTHVTVDSARASPALMPPDIQPLPLSSSTEVGQSNTKAPQDFTGQQTQDIIYIGRRGRKFCLTCNTLVNNPEACFSRRRRRFPGFVLLWKTLNSDPVGSTAVCCACV